jgi:[lysine-biosynthesis-protein LysW]---L-2-aminoadipate ligase
VIRVGVLCSRPRVEEKLLFEALTARGLAHDVVEEARLRFDLDGAPAYDGDIVLERCADPWRAAYAVRLLEAQGVRCLNPFVVAERCSNKLLTTAALTQAGVPHPRTMIALEADEALAAAETLGYPVVFKPALGAWGHLLGKVNDRQGAEAVLEHKEVLGTYHHTIFYVQEFIAKPGRDIRLYVVGERVVAAIYRRMNHWSSEVARDLAVQPCPIDADLERLALRAARAVGGGILTVDCVEDAERGPLVIEVGHALEFRAATRATGVDIAGAIVEHVLAVADAARPRASEVAPA